MLMLTVAELEVRARGRAKRESGGCAPSGCGWGRVPTEGLGRSPPEAAVLMHSV